MADAAAGLLAHFGVTRFCCQLEICVVQVGEKLCGRGLSCIHAIHRYSEQKNVFLGDNWSRSNQRRYDINSCTCAACGGHEHSSGIDTLNVRTWPAEFRIWDTSRPYRSVHGQNCWHQSLVLKDGMLACQAPKAEPVGKNYAESWVRRAGHAELCRNF